MSFPLTVDKGHTATVFGATGFLGRYIVNRLGRCYQTRQVVPILHVYEQREQDVQSSFHFEKKWRSVT
jgi:hypothetical protein